MFSKRARVKFRMYEGDVASSFVKPVVLSMVNACMLAVCGEANL
eukprot:SAG11_NODE_1141_length_5707_cov_14.979315_4_plen_44_part_00